ncbi:MAG: hypothetical protein ACRD4F_01920, partial [Candidatus Angelobacter sp.]
SSVASALHVCSAMISLHGIFTTAVLRESIRFSEAQVIVLPVVIGVFAALVGRNSNTVLQQPEPSLRLGFAVSALLLISFLFMNSTIAKEFVYFAF